MTERDPNDRERLGREPGRGDEGMDRDRNRMESERDLDRDRGERDRLKYERGREDASRESSRPGGRGWGIVGIISGIVAILIIPILFGPLGIVFGIVSLVKGSRGLGIAAIVVGVLGMIIGLVVGAILLSMFGGQAPQG
ncbi:MAG: hypothetical protein ACRDSJ_21725 [Rubrobacteraceae bacterium]